MEDETAYYSLISSVIASPTEYMVQLDDIGIDFSKLSSFELFLILFNGIKRLDTSLVFGDLDLSNFETAVNQKNNNIVLIDQETGIVIDRAIHGLICDAVRDINRIEKNERKPGNEEAKKYMIERARIKQRRASKRKYKSQLEELIVALVNTPEFKYGYQETLDLTIYQFNASVYQIVKKVNYDNLMIGCYSGTVNTKEISPDQLNWLASK